jgi:hypothetical protein
MGSVPLSWRIHPFPSPLTLNGVDILGVVCTRNQYSSPSKLDPYLSHFLINWKTLPYHVGMGEGEGGYGVGAKRVNCSRTLVIPAAGNLPISASRKTARLRIREHKPNPHSSLSRD